MNKMRTFKIVLLLIVSILVTILTALDWLIPDPVLFLDELGLTGGTLALWGALGKIATNKNKTEIEKVNK